MAPYVTEPPQSYPLARKDGLLVEEVGDEVVVYDTFDDTAHLLDPITARIWRMCDGATPIVSLSTVTGADDAELREELTQAALSELSKCNLLVDGEILLSAIGKVSRRALLQKMAAGGALALSLPVITSLTAPAAAVGLSTPGVSCGTYNANAKKCTGGTGCTSGQCLAVSATPVQGTNCTCQ